MEPSHFRVSVEEVLSELLLLFPDPLMVLLLGLEEAEAEELAWEWEWEWEWECDWRVAKIGMGDGATEVLQTEERSFSDQWCDCRDSRSLSWRNLQIEHQVLVKVLEPTGWSFLANHCVLQKFVISGFWFFLLFLFFLFSHGRNYLNFLLSLQIVGWP